MSTFKSQPVTVGYPASVVAEKFSDISHLQSLVEKLPEAERAKMGDVVFDKDSIAIRTSQVGEVKFKITERSANLIKLQAVGAPVPVGLDVVIDPLSDNSCEVHVAFDVQVPAMLRPLVAPHMQKAVDMLGDLIGKVASAAPEAGVATAEI